MATNFRRQIGRNRRHAFLLGTRIPNGWQYGKADGRINSAEVLSVLCTNLVNFGPLTPEFTVMVWRPFMRQMGEIGQTRSIRQWMAGITDERIGAKFTRKTCLVFRSWNVKVKSQRSRSSDKKRAVHTTPHAVWTKWNGLVADNVAQAAGASILSLARGVFAGMRSACGGPGGLPLGSATHF